MRGQVADFASALHAYDVHLSCAVENDDHVRADDTGNANTGGELGTFEKGRMVPPFEKAAFAAEIGKVTEPVKSQFGYHLIVVEEHKTKPFDEVKPQIEKKLGPEMAQKKVADLKKSTPVVLDESYFGK